MAESSGNGTYAVVVDTGRRLPGRGAWVHPQPQCVHQAIRRRAFQRALRITGSPDTSAVVEHVGSSDRPAHQATEQVATNMSTP
ncbi:YlxR family protein [Mycobacterium kubicae]|uniref:YlxR family protein n=1 Tax=Mycobacterium kubicae TaxID=120959 RepID=UPI001F11E1F5|nr:YlxR family protein [Mycobacterium kubicae]